MRYKLCPTQSCDWLCLIRSAQRISVCVLRATRLTLTLNSCVFPPSWPRPLQACLHTEGHMDDGLTLQRCQHEESRAARIIRNTTLLFNRFIRCAATLAKAL